MRILTVRQPWAYAIIHLGKDVENRTRNIAGAYRGPVAIHAAKSKLGTFDASHAELWPYSPRKHVLGAIIGVVDLVDVHMDDTEPCNGPIRLGICSRWAEPGMHHLVLANPRPLVEPIPYRGALGLRTLPDDVAAAVAAGIREKEQE